jgi:FKBP-type peptidyl-prolyl cis-trans isomerase
MKKIVFYSVLVSLTSIALFSCKLDSNDFDQQKEDEQTNLKQYLINNNITVLPTASGLYVIPKDSGTGIQPVDTSYVMVNMTGYLLTDANAVFETTDSATAAKAAIYPYNEFNGPACINMKDLVFAGLFEGIKTMKEGGKSQLIIPSKLALGVYYTSLIPSYSTLIYNVELLKVINDTLAYKKEQLNSMLTTYGIDSTKLSNGVFIVEKTQGTGDTVITSGLTVYVKYSGKLSNGYQFDKNLYIRGRVDKNELLIPGVGSIKAGLGLDKALLGMRNGGKVKVIIPWNLAYGDNYRVNSLGQIEIPRFSSLYFELELLEVYK